MEFNLDNQSLGAVLNCLDSVAEQNVDLDFTLPDYCPDIEKILKCSLIPQIYSRNLTGGQLVIDGMSTIQVLYVDAVKKNIRCCEQTVPFSAAFSVKETPESYIILSDTKAEYLNCRALSPRRLVLHGAFSLYAKVMSKIFVDVFSPPAESETLETFCKTVNCCTLKAFAQEQFSVSEDVSVSNKPPIEAVLNKKVTANLTDTRIIPGKLMLNGEINLKLLYLSDLDTGEPQQLDYMLPFNKIIDCENLEEDTVSTVMLQVLSFDVHLKSDMLSENPVISLECKMAVSLMGYKNEERQIITDAYSTKYMTRLERTQQSLVTNASTVKDTFMHKCSLDLGNVKISKVLDLFNEHCTVSPTLTEEGVTLTGKANICILAYDSENVPVYLERMMDFEHTISFAAAFNSISDVKAHIKSLSYRLAENDAVEVRAELTFSLEAVQTENQNCVTSIVSVDDKEIEPSKCSLTLYYAQKGERLWDIAKNYNTKLSLLTEENSIENEVLEEPSMLLIPSV